jgi:isopentenyl diphosphate isomerase/L-lactate dehydrogenase-like FMN-dependent dehydrogenase
MPRMLVGASERDLSAGLLGLHLPSPALMAPIGVIGLCSQDGHGDLATADAAGTPGVPMIRLYAYGLALGGATRHPPRPALPPRRGRPDHGR